MAQKLPIALEKEPLIDAIFEMRMEAAVPLGDIVPGFLLFKLSPQPTLTRLPAAEIPLPLRSANPDLKFTPIQRLEMPEYFIAVGDQSVAIGAKLPYPKWAKFKEFIETVVETLATMPVPATLIRHSIKYINLIEGSAEEGQSKIKMQVELGDVRVAGGPVSIRIEKVEDGINHILTVASPVEVEGPQLAKREGTMIDIDSIVEGDPISIEQFHKELPDKIERLRQANKIKFFSCLTDSAIEDLGPKYE